MLCEEWVLLALDVRTGLVRPELAALHAQRFLASTLVAEMAVQHDLAMGADGGLRWLGDLPNFHLLIAEATDLLRRRRPPTALSAIEVVQRGLPGLRKRLLAGLAGRDVLHRDGGLRFVLFGTRRYPVRSIQAQREALAHLQGAVDGQDTSIGGHARLLLATAAGVVEALLGAQAQEQATRSAAGLRRRVTPSFRDDDPDAAALALLLALTGADPV